MRDAWLDLYITDILDQQVHRNGIRFLPKWLRWFRS